MAHVNTDCEAGALSRFCSIKLFFSNKQIASIAAERQIALYLHTEFHAALKGSEQHTTRASLFTLVVPISVGPRPRSRIVHPALIIATVGHTENPLRCRRAHGSRKQAGKQFSFHFQKPKTARRARPVNLHQDCATV